METEIILIYTTHPDLSTAKKITQSLLEKKLVACGNLFPAMQSFYWWQGKIEEATEIVALFKTQKAKFDEVQAEIEKLHPYDVPCILQIDAPKCNASYSEWIRLATKPN